LLRHCDVLKLNVPNSQQINRLKRLSVLTLGDFAAVLRQSRFKPIREVDYLIDSLEEECAVKKKTGASIGFVC
jgi:transitional endoplasmic reticulum ATPase